MGNRWGISAAAAALHADALVCDFTLPYASPGDLRNRRRDMLERFRASGVDCVSLTLGGDPGPLPGGGLGETVRRLAQERAFFLAHPDDYRLIETAADIEAAKREGRLGIVFHFQGTGALEGDLGMVEAYYRLGVRHMLIAYNARNLAGDGCFEPDDAGLSLFGRRLVDEMNRVGMLLDCSHTGRRTSLEAMERSMSPVIFSHSNPAAIHAHPRNITDDQIRACAATGGVIGIMGVSNMMGPDGDASVECLLRHVDYCVNLAGVDHVGLSLDFVYDLEETYALGLALAGGKLPEGGGYRPDLAVVEPEQYPRITEGLLARGLAEAQVRQILGGNWLRVARAVWK
jgi:membrane dipeptidase